MFTIYVESLNFKSGNVDMSHYNLQPQRIGAVNWIGLSTLIRKEISRFLSVYLQTIVAPVMTSAMFYAVLALAFGGLAKEVNGVAYMTFLAPGLILMAMVQNAFSNTSSSLMIAKIQGTVVDLLMPPISSVELYVGMIIGAVTRALIIGFVGLGALFYFSDFGVYHLGTSVTFAFLGAWMMATVGIMGGVWADKFDHIAAVTNFVITPLTFLSGTFYSIMSLPEKWQVIAHYNPFFYMIDGFRYGFIDSSDGNLLFGFVFLTTLNLILTALTLWMLKTGYKIKS